MSNPLDDRLKNEYSTQYVLVTNEGSFYPVGSSMDQEKRAEKISQSAVAGLNYEIGGSSPPTKVDPFRQAIGKFRGKNANDFYDAYTNIIESNLGYILLPLTYQSFGNVFVTSYYEDVSDQWGEFFDTNVYPDSVNLKRKATRLKIKFASDDLLQNRLSMLSLITDINKKNQEKAYTNIGGFEEDFSFSQAQVQNALVNAKVGLSVLESQLAEAQGKLDALQDDVEIFAGQVIAEGAFELQAIILDLESKIEEKNQEIADLEQEIVVAAEQARAIAAYLSFQPANSDYNYDAVITKNDIDINPTGWISEYASYGFYSELPDELKPVFDNEWEKFTLNALGQAVKNNQFDSFYSPAQNAYTYDTRLMYTDNPFMMQLPMSPKAMSLVNTPAKNELFVDIKPTYNYYSKYYEEGTKQETYENLSNETVPFSELEMPLVYEVPLDEDGTAQDSQGDQLLPNKFKFNEFGFKLLNCGYEGDSLSHKNFNIVLDQNSKEFLDKYDNVKTQFPFYIDFEFKADSNKDFSTLFNSTGMTNELVKTWIQNIFTTSLRGSDQTSPSKDAQISSGLNGFEYYNPLDESEEYRELITTGPVGLRTSPICREEIYKINETKDFYKIVAAETSIDAETLDQLGPIIETAPNYMTREFDLNRWIDGYINAIAGATGYENWLNEIIPANQNSKTFSESEDFFTSGNDLEKAVKAVTFLGKYRQLVDEKSRNYYDIMNKELAYSETMFYRVQKVAINEDGSIDDEGYVQNFWLIKPNDKENEASTDIMRYIDTQVKYDQNYEYTVYAYQLVVGTRYGFQFENGFQGLTVTSKEHDYAAGINDSAAAGGYIDTVSEYLYENLNSDNYKYNRLFKHNVDGSEMAIFDVVCEPDVKLIEMPFYKKKVVISDAASTAPEVDIVPLNGKKDQIKINFYPATVSRELQPISVENGDFAKYGKIRVSQDRDLLKESFSQMDMLTDQQLTERPPGFYVEPKLLFRTDDFPIKYQIYRMDTPPDTFTGYASFSGNKRKTLNPKKNSSFTDTIEVNKKYYYMFRSFDVHDNPSYPSPIYEVEMVENSGATYPVISIWNFPPIEETLGSKIKSFRRYLKIDAAAPQGVVNRNKSDLENASTAKDKLDQVVLGPDGPDSWKLFSPSTLDSNVRKFKFRVRSKHTGKIVDLNVAFKMRKNKPAEAIDACND